MKDIYILVDCNNFYASCERVFNPKIRNKPVVVLSNNDGCAIARSDEAKALGIKMGQPIFQCKDLVRQKDIKVFSSNFALYGDMSRRVMSLLSQYSPEMEIYSIDEAFLCLKGFSHQNLMAYGERMRKEIKQCTGLPVSIGIAATKTLAKVANHIAKKQFSSKGVFCLLDSSTIESSLAKFPVGDIWGVGRRREKFLMQLGIDSALKFRELPDAWLKKHLTVMGLRTAHELRGVPCVELERMVPQKKAILTSRSFGYRVTEKQELYQAVCAYTARTAEKMRKQKSVAGAIMVFIQSNPFNPETYYENSATALISPASADTSFLTHQAKKLLDQIYRTGYEYKKAGVMVSSLVQENRMQADLFGYNYKDSRRQKLMRAIDLINQERSGNKIFFASEGLGKPWHMRQTKKSARFTTRWEELLEIRI